jgi:fido (protein-threonine AMPylation protein)
MILVWIEYKSYPLDEIVARFHHRLVWIHPFGNGNGRQARLMADFILVHLVGRNFLGGWTGFEAKELVRKQIIEALRAADGHDYEQLLGFVRS